jgi:tRNA threonylcarbamoyladenosine biosynthesis protein TsaB
VGSIALSLPGGVLVREIATPREQTAQLLKLVDELLAEAGMDLGDLDGIAFGRGPGSFTGLRIAAAVAQGLALARAVPLLPSSSLLSLAQHAWRKESSARSLVCVDAHMGEVFWGEYEVRAGLAAALGPEHLGSPALVGALAAGPYAAVGGAFTSQCAALATPLAAAQCVLADLKPTAEDLFPQATLDLAAGRAAAPVDALPVYLREETAWRRGS